MAVLLEKKRVPPRKAMPGPIGFIGAGRVGTALAALLNACGISVAGVSSREMSDARRMALSAKLNRSSAKELADTVASSSIVFLTVPDDAIGPLCQEIADAGGWRAGQGVVHCSGALPSSILQAAKEQGALVASFHPLQAFASIEAAIAHMPGSTFGLEGDLPLVEDLRKLVALLGGTALLLTPEEKTLYHAAAVIASNYTVTLAALASQLLAREGIAPDANTALRYLLPLLRGTIDNLEASGLPGALTGPLARGDAGTVARHLQELDRCSPDLAHLYRHLAQQTIPLAQEKGGLSEEELSALNNALL